VPGHLDDLYGAIRDHASNPRPGFEVFEGHHTVNQVVTLPLGSHCHS
jgi:hypothetical protein